MSVIFKRSFENCYTNIGWVKTKVIDIKKNGYYTLRPWQTEAFLKLKYSKYWALFAPMGSGKSFEIQALVYKKLRKNKSLRAVIAVPQTIIAQSFKSGKFVTPDALEVDWGITNNACDPKERNPSIEGLLNFLKEVPAVDVMDRVFLCSHAALIAAFKLNSKLFKDVLVVVDETHHSKFTEFEHLEDPFTNELGLFIEYAFKHPKQNIELGISTATFFRGDRHKIVSDKYMLKFDTYEYAFDEFLRDICQFDSFTYDFLLYDACYGEALDLVFKKEVLRTIVYIPSVLSTLSKGKHNDVQEVFRSIAKSKNPIIKQEGPLTLVKRGDTWIKVVDLVDPDSNREEKKAFIEKAHNSDDPSMIDVVIALGMFKEGANWKWAEQIFLIGQRDSLTEHIQILGRLFRPAKNKKVIKIFHAIPYTFDRLDEKECKETLNDYLKSVLLSMVFENIFKPINLILRDKKERDPKEPQDNYLKTLPPDVYTDVLLETIKKVNSIVEADEKLRTNKKAFTEETKKIIKEALINNGVTKNINILVNQFHNFLSSKAIECAKLLNIRALKFNLIEEDPFYILMYYTSKNCTYKTFQDLKLAYKKLGLALGRTMLPFGKARELVRKLKFKNYSEYVAWWKHFNKK